LTPIKEDIASPKAQAIKIAVKAFKNDSASVKVVEDRPESA